jgi:hypothetical protein
MILLKNKTFFFHRSKLIIAVHNMSENINIQHLTCLDDGSCQGYILWAGRRITTLVTKNCDG